MNAEMKNVQIDALRNHLHIPVHDICIYGDGLIKLYPRDPWMYMQSTAPRRIKNMLMSLVVKSEGIQAIAS